MNKIRNPWSVASRNPVFLPAVLLVALVIVNWILQPNLFNAPVFRINILPSPP